jgi:uncharacterized protein (TIGR02757 family)
MEQSGDDRAGPIADATRKHRPRLEILRFARAELVRPSLDALLASADRTGHLGRDPLEFVHLYTRADDRELVGLLASAVAYGRVDLFKPRLRQLLVRLGPEPARFARESTPAEVLAMTADFQYRMTGPADLGALLFAAGRLQRQHGSLGALARTCFDASGEHWREALDRLVATLWSFDLTPFIGQPTPNRRLAHLVASPGGQSACKRLNLYARWMVRGPDGVDAGLWPIPPRVLVMPLDTHVHRISRFLGLTRRTDLSWRTAEEITARLRHLDPDDPVKYDFALSHLGISGECPSRRDAVKCARCPLKPVCRVWDAKPAR